MVSYVISLPFLFIFFFFNDTATTEIYTLSLHDALPIFQLDELGRRRAARQRLEAERPRSGEQIEHPGAAHRSEEHTSELQSPCNLVCRLLLEKKKKKKNQKKHTDRQHRTLRQCSSVKST